MAELVAGAELPVRTLTVDVRDMRVFTLLMRDPNPLHFDPAAVRVAGLGDAPINQGTITMAYPLNALLAALPHPGALRTFRCRFLGSVHAGDEVRAGGTVTSVDDDVATVEVWLDGPDGARVLEGTATVAAGAVA